MRKQKLTTSVVELLTKLRDEHPGEQIRAVEIGVWKGTSSRYFLEQIPELRLIMIDPWAAMQEYLDSGDKTAKRSQDEFDAIAELARRNTEDYADRRLVIRKTSAEAAKLFGPESMHLVFIDGNHGPKFVAQDLRLWWPKIKPRGILCGHDYGGRRCNSGVKPAVDQWAAETGQTLEFLPDKVFWTRKAA